jgi:hypothetical protein
LPYTSKQHGSLRIGGDNQEICNYRDVVYSEGRKLNKACGGESKRPNHLVIYRMNKLQSTFDFHMPPNILGLSVVHCEKA